ncbi:MAG: endo alpha-1,4 polygalactosaminidase [Lachnospiraceae bacterium]|nr:endo alpha-1,4 polygalactosaminidase [Lachnospiraceae bacterium]
MRDSKFGKVIMKILPFIVLIGICVAIAFIFGHIADRQLERRAEEQAQTENDAAALTYGVFLNADFEEAKALNGYDTIVIDAQYFTEAEITALTDSGTKNVYSYLNVGSLEQFRDYYFLYETLTLDTYENWEDEKWVNVSDPKWAEFIDELSDELLAKGIHGFFVDNCDVYYHYKSEETYDALVSILTSLKAKGCDVIINGGDVFVTEALEKGIKIGTCFDGVNQESVYTSINWEADTEEDVAYEAASEDDKEYFTEYLGKVSEAGGRVYVIEYADTAELAENAKAYAAEHGWVIYVSESIELGIADGKHLGINHNNEAGGETGNEAGNETGNEADNASGSEGGSSVGQEVDSEEELLEAKINEWLENHTIEEKVAQLFVITPEALTTNGKTVTTLNDSLIEGINGCPIGGFIFFARNLKNREQTIAMLGDIEAMYEQIEMPVPFLAVDEEGGLVARIGNNPAFDVDSTVPMSEIGATGDADYAYQVGTYIGSYLYELGFNMNMAPDADVLSNPSNTVIGNRSFGSDSSLVAEMVIAESQALSEQNITFAVKHFPGHGSTEADSHNGYAYTDKSLAELYECELIPFKEAIDAGIGVIMVGHISVPNITDDDVPSSLSEYMITNVLRGDMGFEGIVITDAMNMGAVTKQYSSAEAAVLAIQAGSDIILMPEDFYSAYNGVLEAVNEGYISVRRIDESVRRILREKWQ